MTKRYFTADLESIEWTNTKVKKSPCIQALGAFSICYMDRLMPRHAVLKNALARAWATVQSIETKIIIILPIIIIDFPVRLCDFLEHDIQEVIL